MTTRHALPQPEATSVIREFCSAVPELATTMESATSTRVDRLSDESPYPGVEFFAVTMTISQRPVSHICARTGGQVMPVGDPTTIDELNRRVGLSLESPDAAASYLRSWFRLAGRSTDWIVESTDQFEWTPSASRDAELRAIAEQAKTLVHPLKSATAGSGEFQIEATVMHQQTLQSRVYLISVGGAVREMTSTNQLTRVPVPYVVR